MPTTYRRIQTPDSDLNRVQDSVNTAIQSVTSGPFVDGNILTNTTIQTGVTQIPHKLSYTPTAVFLGPADRSATVWMPQVADSSFIYLQASPACILQNIWVK